MGHSQPLPDPALPTQQAELPHGCVTLLNGALHYSTGTKRGLDIGFSSCAAPTSYSCLSISGAFQGLQGFWKCRKWSGSSEVIQNWSIVQREGSIEVKYEARSLE